MSKSDKCKSAGKLIVVILSLAILFFLLLPFLDNSAPASGEANGKKASPQIFTSNPLSDLVQKVYNLFARNHSHEKSQQPLYAAAAPEQTTVTPDEQRYAAEEKYLSAEPSVSSTDATYDYGDAGIIGEDGEWILVRQTVPKASQQGMHEISSKENAYDKYVRQERAARYTGRPNQQGPDIPDSKWARLWNPIKNFFTGDNEASSVNQQFADTGDNYYLASANGGLGKDAHRRGNSYRKGAEVNLPESDWEFSGGNNDKTGEEEGFSLVEFLLNEPDEDKVFKSLEKMAEGLSAKNREKANQFINNLKAMNNDIKSQIEEDAREKDTTDFLQQTLDSCGALEFGGLKKDPACPVGGHTEETKVERQEKLAQKKSKEAEAEVIQQQKEASQRLERLLNEAGIPGKVRQENLVVIAQRTDPEELPWREDSFSPDQNPEEMKMTQDFWKFIYEKQGCDKESCFWVATNYGEDPELSYTVEVSGMKYMGDPLGVAKKMVEEFGNKLSMDAPEDETIEQYHKKQELFGSIAKNIYYYPYNSANMQELAHFNDIDSPNDKKRHFVYTPSAAEAKDMLDNGGHIWPSVLIYDEGEGTPSLAEMTQRDERGLRIRNTVFKRFQDRKKTIDNLKKQLEEGGKYIMGLQAQEEAERMKKMGSASMEEQVGL